MPAVAVGAVMGLLVARAVFPRHLAPAFEAFSWLGRFELDRFVRRTGGRFPTDPGKLAQWLAALPETEENRLARVEVLAFMGRTDEARVVLDGAPPAADPAERMERVSLAHYVDWLAGGAADTGPLREAVADLRPGSRERAMGDVSLALAEARDRAAGGREGWWAPLVTVRPRLGREPLRVTWRDIWLPVLLAFVGMALAGSLVAFLLDLVV